VNRHEGGQSIGRTARAIPDAFRSRGLHARAYRFMPGSTNAAGNTTRGVQDMDMADVAAPCCTRSDNQNVPGCGAQSAEGRDVVGTLQWVFFQNSPRAVGVMALGGVGGRRQARGRTARIWGHGRGMTCRGSPKSNADVFFYAANDGTVPGVGHRDDSGRHSDKPGSETPSDERWVNRRVFLIYRALSYELLVDVSDTDGPPSRSRRGTEDLAASCRCTYDGWPTRSTPGWR